MNDREELEALRRLAELEAKAAGGQSGLAQGLADAGQPKEPKGASGAWGRGSTGTWEPPSGFKRGFITDPVTGLQQLAAETEIASLVAPEWAKRKQAEIQKDEAAYQAARGDTGVDWSRLAGQVVNPVNLAIAAATKTPPGASMLTRAGMGAMGGGLMGGMAPTYGETSRGEQSWIGAAGGAIAAPITGALARIVQPKVDSNVALLRREGITPTLGQSMGGAFQRAEDKAMSFPILGDAIVAARKSGGSIPYQKAIYNRALNPIGEKAGRDVGHAGIENVHATLSKAYDDLLPKLGFKPDAQFVSDTAALKNMLANASGIEAKDVALYDAVTNRVMGMGTPQGLMSGEMFKRAESEIGREIVRLAKDQAYGKQVVHDALQQFREHLRQGLNRSNPMYQDKLRAINDGWANYAILRRAASGPQAAQTGMVTPSQHMQGVQESAKRAGQAAGRAKLSEGKALQQDLASAAYSVLPSKYPDSGTAGRVLQNVLVNPVVGIPQMATGATIGAAGSVPYLPGVRSLLDLALNARPQGAGLLADVIRSHPALLAPAAVYGTQ